MSTYTPLSPVIWLGSRVGIFVGFVVHGAVLAAQGDLDVDEVFVGVALGSVQGFAEGFDAFVVGPDVVERVHGPDAGVIAIAQGFHGLQGGLGDVDHGAAQVGGEAGLFVVAVHFVVLAAARRTQAAAFGAEVDVAGAVAFGFAHLQPLFFGERPAFASGMYQGARAVVVAARLDVDVAVNRANQGRGGGLDVEFGLAALAAAAEEYAPAAGTHQAGFVFAVFFDTAVAVFAGFEVDVAFVGTQHGAVVADDVHAGGVDVALSRRNDDGIAGDGAGFVLMDFGFDVVARVGAFEEAALFAFAGADGVLNGFPRLGVNAFGAVEVYLAFAAVEFGGFQGQFAIGGDDGQFAVAGGVYAFVFAPVVVVVVARILFVEGLFVDKFCTQVGFLAFDGYAVATGKAGKQNQKQHRYRTQAVLTLCRFCAVGHEIRNECGHYAC
ncbi:hypothetical protein HMPREF9080_02417 [Cardiobacterium valvarum F0432]|uniref:Uncharacterized protein n=1 Tax=Cardiobacterium valvarum F0432 TaxID=797473 RepID=G9ZI09_9GAMM|nr:hypothetical protein HMPREF9080_02417 [Cardiobacterium valvarum F0432]